MKNALLGVAHYWLWLVALVPLRLHQVAACTGRSMLNATSGVITDGAGNYPASANCEWLIDGKQDKKFLKSKKNLNRAQTTHPPPIQTFLETHHCTDTDRALKS